MLCEDCGNKELKGGNGVEHYIYCHAHEESILGDVVGCGYYVKIPGNLTRETLKKAKKLLDGVSDDNDVNDEVSKEDAVFKHENDNDFDSNKNMPRKKKEHFKK